MDAFDEVHNTATVAAIPRGANKMSRGGGAGALRLPGGGIRWHMIPAAHACTDPEALARGPLAFDWLFLDMNSFFASVEQQEDPQLRGKPVAVVPVMTPHTCAIAASYEAKRFGIKTGTNIGEALQKCPQLKLVIARHEAYVRYHEKVLTEVDRHLPVFKVHSIDELACQLTGKWREPGTARTLAAKIKTGMAENVGVALTCSIGLSTNRLLAKIAADMKKPDGLTELHPRDFPGRLRELTLRDIPGIGRNMEVRLHRAGYYTVEQLWHSQPERLRTAWGSVQGERMWYALHGVELPLDENDRGSVGHSHVLAPEQRPLPLAEVVGRRLLLKAASRMRRYDCRCRFLSLSARVENGPRLHFERRFPALCDSNTLQEIFSALWAECAGAAGAHARIKKVSVTLMELTPESAGSQPELFALPGLAQTPANEQLHKRERLAKAMDSLTARFGRDAVTTGIFPGQGSSFTGTKIAFNRVPELSDFEELSDGDRDHP
jgi:DNA polymerase-4